MFSTIVSVCSGILTILGVAILFPKALKAINVLHEGQLCLLRSQILAIYNAGIESQTMSAYTRDNLDDLYSAYKTAGGNHFVDDIYEKMRQWTVTTG